MLLFLATDNQLFACPYKGCSTGSLTEDNFGNHVFYHMSSNLKTTSLINCKFCQKQFDGAFTLRDHLLRMHKRHHYFCSICLETTPNPRLMLYHMRSTHGTEFQKNNCQQHFIELPSRVSESTSTDEKCYVSAIQQPYGSKQLEQFLCRLIDEVGLRREGRKLIYRPSELGLLSLRMNNSNRVPKLECAKCQIKSVDIKFFYSHLLLHLRTAVRLAYDQDTETGGNEIEVAEQALQIVELSSQDEDDEYPSNGNTPESDLVAQLPSKQIVLTTRHKYVPKDKRFICSVLDCGEHLATEMALRQHLTTKHSYAEYFKCPHCSAKEQKVLLEKMFEHLSYHKRHLYQCGACNTFNPKRQVIDRHIPEKHPGQNVSVIIHRRYVDESTQQIRTEQRSLKRGKFSVSVQLDWVYIKTLSLSLSYSCSIPPQRRHLGVQLVPVDAEQTRSNGRTCQAGA